MKIKLFFLVTFSCYYFMNGQNLINMDSWIDGTVGAAAPYNLQGTTAQNSRTTINGPYGENVVVWQALADGSSGMNGGFFHSGEVLDTDKTYRFTFWMRSSGPSNCVNYSGFVPYRGSDGSRVTSSERVNGSSTTWPYFSSFAMPNDNWFLVVAYIHPNGYTGGNLGGVYDPTTVASNSPALPTPSFSTSDYKFPAAENTVNVRIRNFMYNCGSGEYQYTYDPRIEEINGQEVPTIDLLAGTSQPPTGGDSPWNIAGNDITYSAGNVGIQTTAQTNFALAVGGNIIGEEVTVKLQNNWPDYVFTENYSLPTLEEVKKHIAEKGHLINLPSAKEVETSGIELGEMNRLLLEKMEEITLYILQQEERLEKLQDENIQLLNHFTQLENQFKN